MTMRLAAAELVESREILPGQWLQAFHAPEIANGSRAGQFVHVRTGDYSGMVLRRPFSLNTADPVTGIVTIHFRVIGRGTGLVHAAPSWRPHRPARAARPTRSRSIREAGTSCSSPAAWAWPGCGCWPTRRSATGAR